MRMRVDRWKCTYLDDVRDDGYLELIAERFEVVAEVGRLAL